jgi:aldose 1-epimerase
VTGTEPVVVHGAAGPPGSSGVAGSGTAEPGASRGDGAGGADGADGDVRVEVLPGLGARLHRIVAFGHDVLRTPPTVEHHRLEPFRWGAFVMAPWCNRVPGGRLVFGERTVEVPTNTVDDGAASAMHGLAYDRPWAPDGDGALRIEGGDELPWPWSARQGITVDGPTVRVAVSVRNEGGEPMPAGVGLHPWFMADGGLHLRLAADSVYRAVNLIPVGPPGPVGKRTDLRTLGPPPWGMDDVFTDLAAPFAELVWRERGLRCVMEASAAADHGTVAAFEEMDAVAVEPQTHATDGHRRRRDGEVGGIAVLPPGAELEVVTTLRFSQVEPGG